VKYFLLLKLQFLCHNSMLKRIQILNNTSIYNLHHINIQSTSYKYIIYITWLRSYSSWFLFYFFLSWMPLFFTFLFYDVDYILRYCLVFSVTITTIECLLCTAAFASIKTHFYGVNEIKLYIYIYIYRILLNFNVLKTF
jgi:hypothetical protein